MLIAGVPSLRKAYFPLANVRYVIAQLLFFTMEPFVYALEVRIGYMRVNLRSSNIAMTQHSLHAS